MTHINGIFKMLIWKISLSFFVIAAIGLGGCSTYATAPYSSDADTVVHLRDSEIEPVNVGSFGGPGDKTSIGCRAVGPIETPEGEGFAQFIREAIADELKLANKYDPESQIVIDGELQEIDFSSLSGQWDISLLLLSSNGAQMEVSETYDYSTSYLGETACNQTAQALMPAVQNLVSNAVKSPDFSKMTQN